MNQYIADRRFRPESPTAAEAIAWLKTHTYVWYQAPMDYRVARISVTRLKLWKRNAERFAVKAEYYVDGTTQRFTIDNDHLDRLRLPNDLWHHGISCRLQEVRYVGLDIPQLEVAQSNGYYLAMRNVEHAIHFCKLQSMELIGLNGEVLVPASPAISGERDFR